jgi:hypothetical protein
MARTERIGGNFRAAFIMTFLAGGAPINLWSLILPAFIAERAETTNFNQQDFWSVTSELFMFF